MPVVQRKRLTLYRRADLDACCCDSTRRIPGSRESKGAFEKGFFDAVIVGSEVAVMFLNCCHFIAEPDGDLVDAFPGRNQKTRERVSHRMRRNPITSLRVDIVGEGRAKIVSVKPFPMGDVGPEHERIAKPVRFKKRLELDCKRN